MYCTRIAWFNKYPGPPTVTRALTEECDWDGLGCDHSPSGDCCRSRGVLLPVLHDHELSVVFFDIVHHLFNDKHLMYDSIDEPDC